MTLPHVEIRTLDAGQIETLVSWAAAEGWYPGLVDAACFRAADPGGFLGAFKNNEMVSGISGVRYGGKYSFVGLYICRPDMRGNGYGKAVWNACMAMLGGRTIGLDGVLEQQANYRGMGFEPAYRTFRWSGRPSGGTQEAPDIRPATASDFAAIAAIDRRIFPAERATFLEKWLAPPHQVRVATKDGDIPGYGVLRQCRYGCKIGPLAAPDLEAARRLFWSLVGSSGDVIHVDVPEPQGEFAAFLASSGLTKGFETARMYRGEAPRLRQNELFAVTTLELG